MTLPRIATAAEWLARRQQLLLWEKDLTRARDAVAAARRELPMVRVSKQYRFEGPQGPVGLPELFEERRQLIVQHFMFDPAWDEGCPRCTAFVDSLGRLDGLHSRDTSFVVVSRAPLPALQAYRRLKGWSVPWYSSFGSDFNGDFGATMDESVRPVDYNYRSRTEHESAGMPWYTHGEQPGISVFLRTEAAVFHTYSTFARGLDSLVFTRNLLDLTPLGRQDEP